ncbi:hypothetical protein BH11ACT8_BH11ACT8_19760 [soil metagenome]
MALVVAVVIGVWLLNGRDPGTGTTSSLPDPAPTSSAASLAPSPSASPTTAAPSARATSSAPEIDPDSGLPYVDLGDLPPEAGAVVDQIFRGGPYAYDKDGSTFGNYEGLLPDQDRGYYAEYTVETPGSPDRGPRRIITGDGGEFYWTADHYESFSRVVT